MERNRQLPAWTTGRPAQAFTLVELLCAVGLIALLSAVSLPSLADVIQRYRARTAAWQVAGHLRLTRAKAISSNQHHRVCFSKCGATVPPDGYLIQRKEGSNTWALDSTIQAPASGIQVTSNRNFFSFRESGETGDGILGGTVTVMSGLKTFQVTTHYTGRVRVCKDVC
jgi:type IV fimbrial biogenesis protein FimT